MLARPLPRRRRVQQLFCPSLGALRPSLPTFLRPWVRARSSTPSIFHPPSPCHSMRVQPCRFGRTTEREGGRERGPCRRRCSPSSSLNTAAILLPPDQVRSRCSLVCSLGWMEHGTSGAHSIPFPAPPSSLSSLSLYRLVPRTSCDSAIAMLAGAWCHILHPQCAALSASRGCVGRPRTGVPATNFWFSTSQVLFPAHARANTQESIARTYYGACGCWLVMMAMIMVAPNVRPNEGHIPHDPAFL